MTIIDLTHTFSAEMPVYPGDAPPEIRCAASLVSDASGDHQITNGTITTGMHVGTHMDGPLHMIADGAYLSAVPVEKFIGRGVLIDARGSKIVGADMLRNVALRPGDIVMVMTGFSSVFRRPEYYQSYPELSAEFAERLVAAGVTMVAMDTPSPDRPPFPIHRILLGQQVLITENVTNLEKLIGIPEFEITALPAKFHLEAAPTRVVARLGG